MRQEYDRFLSKPLMACGCAATGFMAIEGKNYFCCPVHGVVDVMESPELEGRMARCDYCHKTVPSRLTLPMFRYEPNYSEDRYYCGCRGWD